MNRQMTYTDLKATILRRFILGETYPQICKDFQLQGPKARDLARIFTTELWQYIRYYNIKHPYTEERYRHAYAGHGRALKFLDYYLTPQDLRSEKDFWVPLIDKVVEERGGVDRKLEETDAFERLELTVRATNILRTEGVKTIGDLLKLTKEPNHWNRIIHFGEASRNTVLERLAHHGFNVTQDVLLPSTVELMREALAFVRNPNSLNPHQRDNLALQLESRIGKS